MSYKPMYKGDGYHLDRSPITIPCLSPDEMVCAVCGRHAPVDEIQWDLYNGPGSPMICINCDPEELDA